MLYNTINNNKIISNKNKVYSLAKEIKYNYNFKIVHVLIIITEWFNTCDNI